MSVFSFRRLFPSNLTTNSRPAMLVAAAVVAFSATGAMADIVSVGGSAVVANPPANIQNGQWTSNTETRVWFERQTTLAADLTLSHVNTGFVTTGVPRVSGTVTAGTAVQSYMIRMDTATRNPVELSGFVIFNTPILGLIFGGNLLDTTDSILGRPGITYNTNTNRGLEFDGTPDAFTISADRLRIDFTVWTQNGPTDDIRVVTTIPSPSAAALLGIGGLLAARRRR
jgi:hypothetical protein